jgi:phosphate starvation-inducible PhoH-like protein
LETAQVRFTIPTDVDPSSATGVNDELLHIIEDAFEARITVRGDSIEVCGDAIEVQELTSLLADLLKRAQQGEHTTPDYLIRAISLVREGEFAPSALRDDVLLTFRGKAIRPKTLGQKQYVDAVRANVITFGMGPAGSGKTYLAMALAVAALKRKEVGRIILTRPIVEAGESLGFLPGTLSDKVDPYIRPLYDALYDMTDAEKGNQLIESGIIEIAPLAFMRGRTLSDSFIILDEAQNTTPDQMKMFLTRLGFGSKMVITGDITQADLPGSRSGLRSVRRILEGIDDIAFADLTAKDVVRHSLVARIVGAYDAMERQLHVPFTADDSEGERGDGRGAPILAGHEDGADTDLLQGVSIPSERVLPTGVM